MDRTHKAVFWMVVHVPTLGVLVPLAVLDVAPRDAHRRTPVGAGLSALAVLTGIALVAAGSGAAAGIGVALLAANFLGGLVALAARVARAEQTTRTSIRE